MTADPDTLAAVHRFGVRFHPTEEAPALGSSAWVQLDDDHPSKLAAAVRAGIAFWAAENDLGLPCWPGRLEELVEQRVSEIIKQVSNDLANGTDWTGVVADMHTVRLARRAREAQYGGGGG